MSITILHIAVYSLNSRLRSNRGLATRFNFSDAESSFGASAVNSLLEDSVGGRVSVLGHSQVYTHVLYMVCVHVRLSVGHCRTECLYTLNSTKSCPLSSSNTVRCGCIYVFVMLHACISHVSRCRDSHLKYSMILGGINLIMPVTVGHTLPLIIYLLPDSLENH